MKWQLDQFGGWLADAWPTLAILAIALVVAARVWPWVRRNSRRIDHVDRIPQIETTLEEFRPLLAELSRNSGHSLLDKVNRIDVRVENVENRMVRQDERLHAIEQQTRRRPPN